MDNGVCEGVVADGKDANVQGRLDGAQVAKEAIKVWLEAKGGGTNERSMLHGEEPRTDGGLLYRAIATLREEEGLVDGPRRAQVDDFVVRRFDFSRAVDNLLRGTEGCVVRGRGHNLSRADGNGKKHSRQPGRLRQK